KGWSYGSILSTFLLAGFSARTESALTTVSFRSITSIITHFLLWVPFFTGFAEAPTMTKGIADLLDRIFQMMGPEFLVVSLPLHLGVNMGLICLSDFFLSPLFCLFGCTLFFLCSLTLIRFPL